MAGFATLARDWADGSSASLWKATATPAPATDRLDGAAEADEGEQQERWHARFSEEVMRSAVKLEATVPLSRMTLGELSRLVVGQVLEMPETAPTQTKLSAHRKPLFTCEFGKLGQNFTVRVIEPFDQGKEFIDGLVAR